LASLTPKGKTVASARVTGFDSSVITGAQLVGSGDAMHLAVGTPTRQDGSTQQTIVQVVVTYADGTSDTFDVKVTVYNPKLALVTTLVLNPQTSLYEQKVQVTNTTPFVIDSFQVLVPALPAGVTLYTRTGTSDDGRPVIQDTRAMQPGEVRTFVIEYFAVSVANFPEPALQLRINGVNSAVTPIGVVGKIDRVVTGAENRTYVEFATELNRTYWVQYRDSAASAWLTSPTAVNGTGTTIHKTRIETEKIH